MECCQVAGLSARPQPQPPDRTSEPLRDAAAQFAGLLVQQAFRPLATALGFYGDLVVADAAQALARAEHGGLADRLAAALASAGR